MKFSSILSSTCSAFVLSGSSIRRYFGIKSLKVPWDFGPLGHLELSKHLWSTLIKPGDIVIDATCGNGKDSLQLASLVFEKDGKLGQLYCIDIQPKAIENTKLLFGHSELYTEVKDRIKFICASHESFPSDIAPSSVAAIVYNLGYLPGDPNFRSKPAVEIHEVNNEEYDTSARIQTLPTTTLQSIEAALPLIKQGGLLSITAYPLHKGGAHETSQVQSMLSKLDQDEWRVYSHPSLNKPLSPVLFSAFRIDKTGAKFKTQE